jgi:hypothetical protein
MPGPDDALRLVALTIEGQHVPVRSLASDIEDLVDRIISEAPWMNWKGKGITQNRRL